MNLKHQKTVRVFIVSGDKILLHKRLNTWFGQGQYAVPGGLVDRDETPENAAVRELKEETNLNISVDELNLIQTTNTHEQNQSYENYDYFTKKFSGELKNTEPSRHSDLDWYDLNSLPEPTMLIIKNIIELLPK